MISEAFSAAVLQELERLRSERKRYQGMRAEAHADGDDHQELEADIVVGRIAQQITEIERLRRWAGEEDA